MSVEIVEFFLPFAAKPWERVSRGEVARVPLQTRQWKAAVSTRAALAISAAWRLDGMYDLTITAALPDWHTRDWDNIGKSISDALNAIAWHDDNQVTNGHVEKLVHDPGDGITWYGQRHRVYTHVRITRLRDWPVKVRARKGCV